jgi:periplasmic divalent cation tolerance protein
MAALAGLRLVLISHPREGADAFARLLVERRLAACVQALQVQSTYRWKGALQEEPEVLLLAKTTEAGWPDLQRLLAERHPYEVPECIALEPERVAEAYRAWWCRETAPEGG